MNKIFTCIILSMFVFCNFCTTSAYIPSDYLEQVQTYKTELNKTTKGRNYKKAIDKIIENYGNDLILVSGFKENIQNIGNLNISLNKDLLNMVNYLDSLLALSLEKFKEDANEPLVLAYQKSGKNADDVYFYSFPGIKDSSVYPYQTASVDMGPREGGSGFVGLFYRTNHDEDWKFFAATQESLPCSSYNTEDLQKAYNGVRCYENEGKSNDYLNKYFFN